MPSFVDISQEVSALLEALLECVRAGTVRARPIGEVLDRGFSFGDTTTPYRFQLRRSPKSGVLWVYLDGPQVTEVDSWSEFELDGEVVHQLWTICRNQTVSSQVEEGLAAFVDWLRSKS